MHLEQRKKTSRKHKIRNVLLLYYLAPLMILLNASGVYFYFLSKESLDQELGERLMSIASFAAMQIKDYHLAALSAQDPQNKTFDLLRKKFVELRDLNKMEKIYVFNDRSESLLDTDESISPGYIYQRHEFYREEIDSLRKGNQTTSILFQGKDGQYFKTAFAPILSNGDVIAFIGVDGSAGFFRNLRYLGRALTYFGLICISIVFISSIIVSRKIVRPIENLVHSAVKIGEGNLNDFIDLNMDNEIGFLGFAMDEMRKKIVERDTELQMMLQGVAHEVRNPLGGIELFAGLLQEQVKDTKSTEYVMRIQREIQSLKTLVQEFLDFAKKPSLEMTSVRLRPFFDDLKFGFSSQIDEKHLSFVLDIPEDLEFLLDPEQMRRVFMNLIQNAIQASKDQGEIFLKSELRGDFLIISLRDTGQGIAKDYLGLIFNPFFTTKERGSGLGLAFAKKIVHAHGGKIDVESEVGQGTTFYILLPT